MNLSTLSWLALAAFVAVFLGLLVWRARALAQRRRRADEAAEALARSAREQARQIEARRLQQEQEAAARQAALEADRRRAEAAARDAARLAAEQAAAQAAAAQQAAAEAETARREAAAARALALAEAEAQARAAAERAAAQALRRQQEHEQEQERERAARAAEAARVAQAEEVARAAQAAEAAQAVEAARAAQAAAEPAPPPPAPPARRRPEDTLVLVADDSKVVRVKTGRLLAQHRYRVALAEDGLEAVRLIDAEVPQVLITDVEMPGMDGFSLTRHVRAQPQTAHIPIIMITSADDRMKTAAAEAGVTLVLGKPYAEDALLACIAQAQVHGPATRATAGVA